MGPHDRCPGLRGPAPASAASLAQMVDRQLADVSGDPSRVYVTGLSAGGGMTAVMMAAYPEKFAARGVVAGLPYGCARAAGSPYVCVYAGAVGRPGARRAARVHRAGPWPALTVPHGTADHTVRPANMTAPVEQWTDAHGADRTADVSDTVAGHPHQVFRGPGGDAVVETYRLTGMGHGRPVDPGSRDARCGTADAYVPDVNLCAAHRLGKAWALG